MVICDMVMAYLREIDINWDFSLNCCDFYKLCQSDGDRSIKSINTYTKGYAACLEYILISWKKTVFDENTLQFKTMFR